MIISTCGFGNTGASAVIDYLRGFSEIELFCDFEFQLIHQADGINDLKYHITQSCERIACNAAIKRFLAAQKYGRFSRDIRRVLGDKYDQWLKEYVTDIIQVSWRGEHSAYDPLDVSKISTNKFLYYIEERIDILLKNINAGWHFPAYQEKYFSVMQDTEFDEITKKHINTLLSLLNISNNKVAVIDMLFSVTNPKQGMEFFDDPKAIIINRDPRDVYVSAKLHPEDSRFMPNSDVNQFIIYYRNIQKKLHDSQNVLVIQYEDLIYKYYETTNIINTFIGLNVSPDKEFMYFDPTYSIRYTHRENLYKKYPEDVKTIEKKLQDYLYDFESTVSPASDPCIISKKENVEYKGWNMK